MAAAACKTALHSGSRSPARPVDASSTERMTAPMTDLYNPGRTTPQLFAPNLLDNIQNYGLEVDRIVPIHGGVIDFEELESAVQVLRN